MPTVLVVRAVVVALIAASAFSLWRDRRAKKNAPPDVALGAAQPGAAPAEPVADQPDAVRPATQPEPEPTA